MNTIRNYLESMFAKLPNTPEVIRAKCELGQMMEDKYNELISEGKSDNEAVAQVISEFGNLEDLGDALGISALLREDRAAAQNTRELSAEEVEKYLSEKAHSALLSGLGTFFAIICPSGAILAATAEHGSRTRMAIGIFFLLGAIAACVTLHTYSTLRMGPWSFLKHEPCSIDYATAGMINDQRRSTHDSTILQRTVSILLFCTCYIPLVFLHLMVPKSIVDGAGVVILLVMVAFGVLILTVINSRENGYQMLLSLSSSQDSRRFHTKDDVVYDRPAVRIIMSAFWPTVTCLYLIISFLTFGWAITWIIFPIAGVADRLIKAVFRIRKEDLNK